MQDTNLLSVPEITQNIQSIHEAILEGGEIPKVVSWHLMRALTETFGRIPLANFWSIIEYIAGGPTQPEGIDILAAVSFKYHTNLYLEALLPTGPEADKHQWFFICYYLKTEQVDEALKVIGGDSLKQHPTQWDSMTERLNTYIASCMLPDGSLPQDLAIFHSFVMATYTFQDVSYSNVIDTEPAPGERSVGLLIHLPNGISALMVHCANRFHDLQTLFKIEQVVTTRTLQ